MTNVKYDNWVKETMHELRSMHSTPTDVCKHCGLGVTTWSDTFHTGTGFVFCVSGGTKAEVSVASLAEVPADILAESGG